MMPKQFQHATCMNCGHVIWWNRFRWVHEDSERRLCRTVEPAKYHTTDLAKPRA